MVLPLSTPSLVAQKVKNLPAMQETWVPSLGQEEPLEKGTATHPSILAWRTPRTEEPGGLQSIRSQRVRHDLATNTFTFTLPNKLTILLGGTRRWVDRWTEKWNLSNLDERDSYCSHAQCIITHNVLFIPILIEYFLYVKRILWVKENRGIRIYSSKSHYNCRSLSTHIPTWLFFMGTDG